MDSRTVFEKSPQGVAELAQRSHTLKAFVRTALIMTDGIKTASEIAARLGRASELNGLFAPLIELGLIQATAESAQAVAAPAVNVPAAPSAATLAPPGGETAQTQIAWERLLSQTEFNDVKRFTSKFVESKMGFASESVCMRIESTKTPAQLGAEFEKLQRMLADGKHQGWIKELSAVLAARIG